jgi:hypothetical protein
MEKPKVNTAESEPQNNQKNLYEGHCLLVSITDQPAQPFSEGIAYLSFVPFVPSVPLFYRDDRDCKYL